MQNSLGKLSLCWGSMEGVSFRDFLEIASAAGFGAITINPAQHSEALTLGYKDQDIPPLLADHQLTVSDIDPLGFASAEPEQHMVDCFAALCEKAKNAAE